jgi:hypothetical protein
MGAEKTTFMIVDVRPEGRPHAPTHLPRSLTAGRQAGLSIASWGGVRGPFRWNFTFCIRLFVYVIKSPHRLYSYAPPARDRKPQRPRHPRGFWAWQETETGQGNLQHVNRAAFDGFSSLRLQDWGVCPCRDSERTRAGRFMKLITR